MMTMKTFKEENIITGLKANEGQYLWNVSMSIP